MQNDQIRLDFAKHIELADNILGELSCTGFPYLELDEKDLSFSDTKLSYYDFYALLKNHAYSNDWELDNLSFFNVKPVFSNGKHIPSLMGFHLALILFNSNVASSSSSLYFDTKSNWNKFTKITDRKIYKVASWVRVDHDIDAHENNADNFLYVKTSINLIKNNQLISVDSIPDDTHKIIKKHFNKSESEIITDQLALFLDFIEPQLERKTNLTNSIKYLFILIFCWVYSFDKNTFRDCIGQDSLKFDFEDNDDIFLFSTLIFAFIDAKNVEIGLYKADEFTRKQVQILKKNQVDVSEDQLVELPDEILDGLVQIDDEFLLKKNTKFYKMPPPLGEEEMLTRLYSSWSNQVKMFFLTSLTTETYDVLRSYMHFYVESELKKHNVREIKNLDLQLKAIENCAFSIFQNSFYQAIHPDQTKESPIVQKYFKFLILPDLTEKQLRDIHVLNTREQDEYRSRLIAECRMRFSRLIDNSLTKIAHPTHMKKIFKNFDDLPEIAITQTVFQWYSINYLDAYLKITQKFNEFCDFIEKDVLFFSSSEKNRISMGVEIEYFLRMYQNPQKILDINDVS